MSNKSNGIHAIREGKEFFVASGEVGCKPIGLLPTGPRKNMGKQERIIGEVWKKNKIFQNLLTFPKYRIVRPSNLLNLLQDSSGPQPDPSSLWPENPRIPSHLPWSHQFVAETWISACAIIAVPKMSWKRLKRLNNLPLAVAMRHFLCQMTTERRSYGDHFPWSSLLIRTCGDQLLKHCLRLQEPPSKSIQSDNIDKLENNDHGE